MFVKYNDNCIILVLVVVSCLTSIAEGKISDKFHQTMRMIISSSVDNLKLAPNLRSKAESLMLHC